MPILLELINLIFPSKIRAIIEGQILSIRGHAERLGIPVPPNKLMVTGGASSNSTILKYISLIFGCSVHTVQRPGMQKSPACKHSVFKIKS